MKKIIIIILFIFPISSVYSSGFGFRYEISYLSTNLKNQVSPVNLYISFKTGIYSLTYLKLNFGISYYEELYGGLNGSIFMEKEFYKNYKIIVGANIQKNGGTAHGTISAFRKTFLHFVIGSGINISEDKSIDLLFYIPNEKKYGANYYYMPNILYKKVNYIFKVGFEYYF